MRNFKTTVGDIINVKGTGLAAGIGDGWSGHKWRVEKVYPHMVLCRNLNEDGTTGNQTRCFNYGQLLVLGME